MPVLHPGGITPSANWRDGGRGSISRGKRMFSTFRRGHLAERGGIEGGLASWPVGDAYGQEGGSAQVIGINST